MLHSTRLAYSCVLAASILGLAAAPASERIQDRVNPGEVVLQFTAKEKEFAEAFRYYIYTQKSTFQILRDDGSVREERRMVAEVHFNEKGEREMKVLSDEGGLTELQITQRDIDNILNVQPFTMTSGTLDYYKVSYQGQKKVDELDTYVFDVRPRRMDPGQRYFLGRIWVDQKDLQVVMTRGKPVPEPGEEKFPHFETIRQKVDGQFWFPVWSMADEVLHFPAGSHHLRILVTWEDFREYDVSTKVTFGEVVQGEAGQKPAQEPPPH